MEVFQVGNPLCGWWLSSVGGDYQFLALNSLCLMLSLLGFRQAHPKRLVTTQRGQSPWTWGGHKFQKPLELRSILGAGAPLELAHVKKINAKKKRGKSFEKHNFGYHLHDCYIDLLRQIVPNIVGHCLIL